MNLPEFRNCPGCGAKSHPVPENREYLVVECELCGFRASVTQVKNAELLADVYPLPSVEQTAVRIAKRQPLKYVLR